MMMLMIMIIMMLWRRRLAFGGLRLAAVDASTRRDLGVGRAWAAAYVASGGVVPRRAVLL